MSDNTITHSKHSHLQLFNQSPLRFHCESNQSFAKYQYLTFELHWLKSDSLISLKADSTHIACNDFNTVRLNGIEIVCLGSLNCIFSSKFSPIIDRRLPDRSITQIKYHPIGRTGPVTQIKYYPIFIPLQYVKYE